MDSDPLYTVKGYIKTTPGSTRLFVAVFDIEGLNFVFSGAFDISVLPFEADGAILAYEDVSKLTGTRDVTGQVGITAIKLTFANGPTISGTLEEPVEVGTFVRGSGFWSAD